MGLTGCEAFRGFKLYAAVNQYGLPLRAVVPSGNCYDGQFLPKLIGDLGADYVLADAEYCSRRSRQAVKEVGVAAFIADNPCWIGKHVK